MPKFWIPALLLALFAASTAHAQLFSRKNARVITNAWASPEFVERRMGDEGPIPMTYHFAEGKFYGGAIRDKSLENYTLQDIVETLASDMEEQNFFPAPSTEEGDLVIVVHWGVTEVEEDWDELFPGDESGDSSGGDFSEEGESLDSSSDSYSSDLSTVRSYSKTRENAILTGIDKALNKKGTLPSDYQDYMSLLEEERYFIVLIAYDWQKLFMEKQKEVQFVTRFSLRSPGTNFIDAVPSLSRAAVPHLGTNLDDLAKTKTQLGWGKGTVGELEVVEEIDAAELEEITNSEKRKKTK
ncbi:hypothetical protein QEH56_18395 [Pelagicoccus enzymogenes]|uniref:hypothetical protein n=1 Tax=Pelagicoccus enzymogenes TaxID=2773457 RepID=UPI00280FB3BB|nr:hypothetical protein [Pelagicoccus enzymogenes]MDQ8200140.1 hypothetical protein [Pelagicoccus enzymogenes]